MQNNCKECRANEKQLAIDNYINGVQSGPKQGTEGWHEIRKKSVGGSEISAVMDLNPFKTSQQLILEKAGLGAKFIGDVKTRWGNLFEDIVCKLVDIDIGTRIVGTELFLPGKVEHQTFSPDGIGLIDLNKALSLANKAPNRNIYADEVTISKTRDLSASCDHFISLFEFKCPYIRIPKGVVPEYYLPQVKAGLDTISITEVGLYVEAVIRRCQLADFEFTSKYTNDNDHPQDIRGRIHRQKPLYIGCITFWPKTGAVLPLSEYNMALLGRLGARTGFDFGAGPKEDLELILEAAISGLVDINLGPIIGPNAPPEAYEQYLTEYLDKPYYGHMCWKLAQIDYHIVGKEANYIDDELAEKIKKIIDMASELRLTLGPNGF
jgi:YqaJ-like viral recombinase domain